MNYYIKEQLLSEGYKHEDLLNKNEQINEEVSRGVTKRIARLQKEADKFKAQATKSLTKLVKKSKGKNLTDGQKRKLSKVILQLRKACEECTNVKNIGKFNDSVDNAKMSKEEIKEIEKGLKKMLANVKQQIKDSKDDPLIVTILRDAGIFTLFSGTIFGLLGLAGGSEISPVGAGIGAAVGAYDISVAHHNRNITRNKALTTQHQIEFYDEKEKEEKKAASVVAESYFPY